MNEPRAESLVAACGGTTAIEFALVAPIFMMFLFGTIEFGRLLWTEQALQETAIAGARCMAIAQGTTQSSACASSGTYSSITLNNAATCGGTAGFSQVTLTSTFVTAVPQLVQLAAGGTSLTATACYPNNT